ncbi:hypothetical protein NDU88_009349 [Pleurodeles waltl]|uniref:Uncharacterized protein n=1 Tax=Pleurodeles waltl TaxID=8319 RepID=A0AAV7PUI4_PLEWA|nr:hypothetical protein NDU88_009349 [Pleurodeles waltl]
MGGLGHTIGNPVFTGHIATSPGGDVDDIKKLKARAVSQRSRPRCKAQDSSLPDQSRDGCASRWPYELHQCLPWLGQLSVATDDACSPIGLILGRIGLRVSPSAILTVSDYVIGNVLGNCHRSVKRTPSAEAKRIGPVFSPYLYIF